MAKRRIKTATYRVHKASNYTVMSNTHLRDKNISLKAKGLLSVLLSLPDNWDYSVRGIVSICKENETAIDSSLKELKKFGYLVVTKLYPNNTDCGRIKYVYDIYETPIQEGKKQEVEILPLEILEVENQGQLNTNVLSTDNEVTNNTYSEFDEIVGYLNDKTGKSFKPSSEKTKALIKARFKDGYKKDDFIKVIDVKCKEWKDKDMDKYLRPETLFGTKFESYLNEKEVSSASQSKNSFLNATERKTDYDRLFGGGY